jgi:hypothetical protein
MYKRTDADGNEIIGVKGSSPQLTVARTRRCQNCVHYDTGEKAQRYFRDCVKRDKRVLEERGCAPEGIREHVASLRRGILENLGAVGICLARDKRDDDGAAADFVSYKGQCEQWTGTIIVSAQEAAADADVAAVYDHMGLDGKGKPK